LLWWLLLLWLLLWLLLLWFMGLRLRVIGEAVWLVVYTRGASLRARARACCARACPR
jgi:hypothetical protein